MSGFRILVQPARLVVLLLVTSLVLVPARGQLPALGDGAEMSTSIERQMGDRIARSLYRDPDYIDDPILGEYVDDIWQRLLAGARTRGELAPEMDQAFAWVVMLGRDHTLNAFALPGGYLGVHLGLIAAVASADELASVLAHELSHVTQRHIARLLGQSKSQSPWLIGAMILGMLAASKNPQAAGAMITGGQAVAVQNQLNFSRDMEREADRIGYGVLTQAGFSPQGFVDMFTKLQQANRHNDTGNFPYLRSHPLTSERIADMQARLSLQGTQVTTPMLEHVLLATRARVLSQTGVDGLRSMMASALAEKNPDKSSPVQQASVLYGAVLAAIHLREFDQAQRWIAPLHKLLAGDVRATRLGQLLAAELALTSTQPQQAELALATANMRRRPELLLQARIDTALGQAQRSSARLQVWLADHPADALAWEQLAAAWHAQNRPLSALRAEAEAHVARLDEEGALLRLQAAQELARQGPGPVDYFEASVIDSRVRQLQAHLRENAFER